MLITSTKNEIVKSVRRLRDRSARRESGQHLIEGERLQTLGINRYLTAFRTRDRYLAAQPFRSVIDVCQFAEP